MIVESCIRKSNLISIETTKSFFPTSGKNMTAYTNTSSRRSFVQNVSLASIGALAFGKTSPAVASAKFPKMQFGLVTYLWGENMDLPSLLAACQKSGIRGVELRTEHKHGVEPKLSPAEREETKQRFAASGVILVGYGSNCDFHHRDPALVKKNIEQCKDYIRLMHDCGGSGVKVKPNAFVKDIPHEKTIEQVGKALKEVAEYGYNFGQQIRVEVHGKETSELPVIRDILKVATHPNVGVCWNSNPEDLDGEGLEANFNMVKDRFGDTCHVRELNDTSYPYADLMKLFLDIDFDGWILLEARTKPADYVEAMIEQRKIFDKLVEG
jgi:sugar phosphate isomerase/epimerase